MLNVELPPATAIEIIPHDIDAVDPPLGIDGFPNDLSATT
jgi:hypothetical protein